MISSKIAVPLKQGSQCSQLLMQSNFTLITDNDIQQKVNMKLYENHLLFSIKSQKSSTYKVDFSFDLIFGVILKPKQQKKERVPSGLKFEKLGSELQFVSDCPEIIILWKNILGTRLNQRGFHQLFKPIKKIGKGNFASVYLVIRYEDKQKFAVKAFSKEGTFEEQNGKQSLVNEIQINRRLSHKNLMKIYGVYQSENSIYVAVQLLQGKQLQDKIQAKHKFTQTQIKTVMKGILEGLEYMHERKIMHRDLKPENILLRQENDYDCVIADFGLATVSDADKYLFVRCGTPGFVAPQIANLKDMKAKYDPICDLFSLGVIFHMMALRRPPFPGTQYNEVLTQNRNCKIDFSKQMYKKIPADWLDLMKRLLEKDPKRRITASEALDHEFFVKDSKIYQQIKNRESLRVTIPNRNRFASEDKENNSDCDSPLLLSKNREKRDPARLREDSCLKFKMKENLLTGQCQQGDTVTEINSPLLKKLSVTSSSTNSSSKGNESRFKRCVNQE